MHQLLKQGAEPMPNELKRVLIVDDIEENLAVLTETLTREGFSPLQAKGGERAIEIARKAQPDIILLDIKMPGMDGYETIKRLKADETTRDIPVIFLSALNQIEDKVRGFECGAVDYVSKPFQKEEVLARVSTHITLREAKRCIEAEREKSERLLHTMLPLRVAEELKNTGTSEPELFENVSVFFSDFVNFTENSRTLSPKELIGELNTLYTAFDDIMERNCCERIKTIGDAYLAVCSISGPVSDHAARMATAANEIIKFLKERNASQLLQWKIRIGLHCGDLVGGIVGTKKYLYDIFGDTVNIASRMESLADAMCVCCTKYFAEQAGSGYTFCNERSMPIKGIGEMTVCKLLL